MKKLAFLPALGIVIIACGFGELFIPAPPTPTLPTIDWVPETNAELDVSFKHPPGWAIIYSGTLESVPGQYATYGLKKQPIPPGLRIERWYVGAPLSQDPLVRIVTRGYQAPGIDITEELRETIHGLPAGGIRYSGKNEMGFVLMVGQPRQLYQFIWFSDPEYLNELKQIYQAMLPSISIGPPPP